MATKTPEQIADEERMAAEQRQTAEEMTRQEFERGPDGDKNRTNEDIARSAALGADGGPGGPPSVQPASTMPTIERQAPTADNIMYVVPLNHSQISVGPAIMPHPTKEVIDAMGVKLPSLPKDVDVKQLFLVRGLYVDSNGVPYDQKAVKPAQERISEQADTIADLQRQIAEMRNNGSQQ